MRRASASSRTPMAAAPMSWAISGKEPTMSTDNEPPSSLAATVDRVMAVAHLAPAAHVAVIGHRTLPFVLALLGRGCGAVRSLRLGAPAPDCEPADLSWIVGLENERELDEALRAARWRARARRAGGRLLSPARNPGRGPRARIGGRPRCRVVRPRRPPAGAGAGTAPRDGGLDARPVRHSCHLPRHDHRPRRPLSGVRVPAWRPHSGESPARPVVLKED